MGFKRQILEGEPDLDSYDKIIVSFSGGKDSLACFLHLLELGVSKERIELWHQDVDGGGTFFDWPCTSDYIKAFAKAWGVDAYFQWKDGGFLREMTRNENPTSTTRFELPLAPGETRRKLKVIGGRGKPNTRMQFPQVSADLKTRWCSAYLKIDVATAALRNDPRFSEARIIMLTGERGEESPARAKYPMYEVHKSSNKKRTVHQWRPIRDWTEKEVWSLIEKHRINVHPAYHLGFGRVSCLSCIFGSNDQWHTVRQISPQTFNMILEYEKTFGDFHGLGRPKTIHRTMTVEERADKGTSLIPETVGQEMVNAAMSAKYHGSIFLEEWKTPAGAYKETGGPT